MMNFRTVRRPTHHRVTRSRCGTVARADAESMLPNAPPAPAELPPPPMAEPGQKLNDWFQSPFDYAAFGPRVTMGALMSAPERFSKLSEEVQRVTDVLNSPAPVEDKSKQLAIELETCVVLSA